jgi:hypothetical protein
VTAMAMWWGPGQCRESQRSEDLQGPGPGCGVRASQWWGLGKGPRAPPWHLCLPQPPIPEVWGRHALPLHFSKQN